MDATLPQISLFHSKKEANRKNLFGKIFFKETLAGIFYVSFLSKLNFFYLSPRQRKFWQDCLAQFVKCCFFFCLKSKPEV